MTSIEASALREDLLFGARVMGLDWGTVKRDHVRAQIYKCMRPYCHDWKPNDMVLRDNWRCIHSGSGYDPKYHRRVQRATIRGDHGLGAAEH